LFSPATIVKVPSPEREARLWVFHSVEPVTGSWVVLIKVPEAE
jgi:hypothetical protein